MDFSGFRALTFDCYGTLIDWERGMTDVVQPWLSAMGSPIPPEVILTTYAVMKWRHEQPRPTMLFTELMRRCWRDLEGAFGFPPVAERAEIFARAVGDWPPFPDTVEALRFFKGRYKIGILSNIDNASIARTKRLLEVPFDITVSAEDVDSYKPHLAHFEEAFAQLRRHGIEKHEILHVAQSKYHDIAPAQELGLACVWVNRRHGKRGAGATIASEAVPAVTVTSLAELVAMHGREGPGAGSVAQKLTT